MTGPFSHLLWVLLLQHGWQEWKGYQYMTRSQHRKLTLENKILPPRNGICDHSITSGALPWSCPFSPMLLIMIQTARHKTVAFVVCFLYFQILFFFFKLLSNIDIAILDNMRNKVKTAVCPLKNYIPVDWAHDPSSVWFPFDYLFVS